MTTLLIAIGLFVVVVLALGVRYDRKQHALGAAGGIGKSMRSTRMDNNTKIGEWEAGH